MENFKHGEDVMVLDNDNKWYKGMYILTHEENGSYKYNVFVDGEVTSGWYRECQSVENFNTFNN